jgi:hypothetical protein
MKLILYKMRYNSNITLLRGVSEIGAIKEHTLTQIDFFLEKLKTSSRKAFVVTDSSAPCLVINENVSGSATLPTFISTSSIFEMVKMVRKIKFQLIPIQLDECCEMAITCTGWTIVFIELFSKKSSSKNLRKPDLAKFHKAGCWIVIERVSKR